MKKKRIAVEGLEKEMVSLVCKMLERLTYDICYSHKSAYRKTYNYAVELLENPSDIVKNMVKTEPDLILLCNARGYLPFLKYYSETTTIPLLVLTGGGPELIYEVKRYTTNVLEIPFEMQDLYYTIETILR